MSVINFFYFFFKKFAATFLKTHSENVIRNSPNALEREIEKKKKKLINCLLSGFNLMLALSA